MRKVLFLAACGIFCGMNAMDTEGLQKLHLNLRELRESIAENNNEKLDNALFAIQVNLSDSSISGENLAESLTRNDLELLQNVLNKKIERSQWHVKSGYQDTLKKVTAALPKKSQTAEEKELLDILDWNLHKLKAADIMRDTGKQSAAYRQTELQLLTLLASSAIAADNLALHFTQDDLAYMNDIIKHLKIGIKNQAAIANYDAALDKISNAKRKNLVVTRISLYSPKPEKPESSSPSSFTRNRIIGASVGLAAITFGGLVWRARYRTRMVLKRHGLDSKNLSTGQLNLCAAAWVGNERALRLYIKKVASADALRMPHLWPVLAELFYRKPVSEKDVENFKEKILS